MINLKLQKSEQGTQVSCVLEQSSLTEMAKLDPLFSIGWIVAALGAWIARSNRPGNIRVETDAVFVSIKTHIPSFTHEEFERLSSLECFTSRSDYLKDKLLSSYHRRDATENCSKMIGVGWTSFNYFDSLRIVPSIDMIESHVNKLHLGLDIV